ncbi:MAG TPA: mannose-1-phosphate guanylyltransferase/mannose-6-phosphate isomerase, partial [Abditibacteriaceae bacterium]|nr:mannose-1-phosphate guanylyltransferase/mannose-6-phosphate isomerase [Abditibacteriaceae bacterium]
VVLSGGSGTRLWPLSRTTLPKQLLPLTSELSMLQETILRLRGLQEIGAPLVVCNQEHRFLVAEQLRQLDITPLALILEPFGRNTAPAVAVAAMHLLAQISQTDDASPSDVMMLVLPADHVITDVPAFHAAIDRARRIAEQGFLVTFGVIPSKPETGYGYIRRGAALEADAEVYAVAHFVEKPDLATAQSYLGAGDYCWNSGMFLFGARQYLAELERFHPDISAACRASLAQAYRDLDFDRLEEENFKASPSLSVDYAVMEKTDKAAVVPIDIGWNDMGSWSALWEFHPKDAAGNVSQGQVVLHNARNCYVQAEKQLVAAVGVEDLIIIETSDAVLVMNKDHAQEVKHVVDYLQQAGRTEHEVHRRVYRPWGSYEGVDRGERFQVKRLVVNPGAVLSLQVHHHRSEHWVVVSGTAEITIDDTVQLVTENESVYVPLGASHRIYNPGRIPLHLIEVQSGSYLGEDDIVRLEDVYGRSAPQRVSGDLLAVPDTSSDAVN